MSTPKRVQPKPGALEQRLAIAKEQAPERETATAPVTSGPAQGVASEPSAGRLLNHSTMLRLQRQLGNRQTQSYLARRLRSRKQRPDEPPGRQHAEQTAAMGEPVAALAQRVIQRQEAPNRIQQLNEMLDSFDVPEGSVIRILGEMDPPEKQTVLNGNYRQRIASALNVGEMLRAVNNLGPALQIKLEWVKSAATFGTTFLAYSEISALVTSAPQTERDQLKNGTWRTFFVEVCDNNSMLQAVRDLGFDLTTKLEWLRAELHSAQMELDYNQIRALITAAPQTERDLLKTEAWRSFFVDVCTNATIITAVNDLGFDLQTKLSWVDAEMTWTRAELSYSDIEPLLRVAAQSERDALRTDQWRDFFSRVCTNEEMPKIADWLGGNLDFRLSWMEYEGTDWPAVARQLRNCADDAQKNTLRTSTRWRDFFFGLCDAYALAEALDLLGGALLFKLDWMRVKGSAWLLVREKVANCADEAQKQAVRNSAEMRAFFASLCGPAEISEAVRLLGGDLAFKLDWLRAYNITWPAIDATLAAADEAQKAPIRADNAWKDYFVGLCSEAEMAVAVNRLGGDLHWRLRWLRAKGTTWQLVREQLAACADATQRQAVSDDPDMLGFVQSLCPTDRTDELQQLLGGTATASLTLAAVQGGMAWPELKVQLLLLRDDTLKAQMRAGADWRAAFFAVCDAAQLAEAVQILGGALLWKLGWMLDKGGSSSEQILPIVSAAPQTERDAVAADQPLCQRLRDLPVSGAVFEALGAAAMVASALLNQVNLGDGSAAPQALRVIASAANVAGTIATLRSDGLWAPFLDSCPRGRALPPATRPHVDAIYRNGGCPLEEKKKLFAIRYHTQISDAGIEGNAATPWTLAALDATYDVAGVLPEGMVLDNAQLANIHMVVSGIGTYYPAHQALHLPGGPGYSMGGIWPQAAVGVVEDHFRGTIRHEMGHALDAMVDGQSWYMSDPRVDWDEFGAAAGWIDAMAAGGGWGGVSDPAERQQIRQFLLNHFADPAVNTPITAPADPNHAFNKYPACPIVQVANQNQLEGAHNSYAAMSPIGGRIYTRRPVYNRFYSYVESIRTPPVLISAYGLSAPADWFAEQVREYFRTSPNGSTCAPWVQEWFRVNLP